VLGAICNAGHENGESGAGGPVGTTLSTAARWQLTMSYRWQNSFRHFRGDVEQPERLDDETQVENNLHLFDASLSYQATPRWSFSVGMPFMSVSRHAHGSGTVTDSRGIGDLSIGAKFWLWRPPSENQQNMQFGFSMKLPTGDPNVTNRVGPNIVTVDQSIQQGDSGTGFAVDYLAYKSVRRFTLFATGSYLFNPKNTHTPEGWKEVAPFPRGIGYQGFSGAGTIYSVADQYLLQAGAGYAVPRLPGLAFTGTVRMEGIPARDLIGREDGFRRPGYAVSVGPGVMFSRGQDTWSVSAPIAVRRDRTESVPDVRSGRHGDAAFADYLILVSYSRSF
jgi:Putative MetA-pathway of phenol degradation